MTADIIPNDWQHWSAAKPSIVKPLPGGLSNRSYLILADSRELVLRVNSAMSDVLDLDRSAELDALLLADKAGLCAPLVYCDPQHKYLVSCYITGETWCVNSAGLSQLAALLRSIHQLPAIATSLDISAKLACYWQSIKADVSTGFMDELKALQEKLDSHIRAATSLSSGHCLCHNDLLAANLITATSGALHAIDWEYAAMADPYYELAVIVEGQGLHHEAQQLLLGEYLLRPPTESDWQRLHHWRIIYAYVSVLWYAVQWSNRALSESDTTDSIARQVHELSLRITGNS